ncbi:MAG: hypothetical protein ACFFCI_09910 [Promethearchaeota archaeon]
MRYLDILARILLYNSWLQFFENKQKAHQNNLKKRRKNKEKDANSRLRLFAAYISFIREKILGGELINSK